MGEVVRSIVLVQPQMEHHYNTPGGVVEGLNNKIRVITRSYGFRTHEALEPAPYHTPEPSPDTINPGILFGGLVKFIKDLDISVKLRA